MSSEKRIKVAERLRKKHRERNVPCMFEVQDVYMQAHNYLHELIDCLPDGESAFLVLADLIDPTCRVSDEEVAHQPTLDALAVHVYTCNTCHNPFYMADVCCHPKPAYCPYCGARVVRDHE